MTPQDKILYLSRQPPFAGFDYVACRQLLTSLKQCYPIDVRFAVLPDEQFEAAAVNVKSLTVQESTVLSGEYQVLIIEDFLWVESPETSNRVSASLLRAFLHMGGVAIFLFGEEGAVVNQTPGLDAYSAFLRNCGFPLLYQTPPGHPIAGPGQIVVGYDEQSRVPGPSPKNFSINIDDHYLQQISFPIRAAFKNVNIIVADYPIQVDSGSRVILAGNPRTTRMLTSGDEWWNECVYHVFAGYNDQGNGCSVLLTGRICNDRVLSLGESDALRFMLNLLEVLLNYQRERLGVAGGKPHATDVPEPVQIRFVDSNTEPEDAGETEGPETTSPHGRERKPEHLTNQQKDSGTTKEEPKVTLDDLTRWRRGIIQLLDRLESTPTKAGVVARIKRLSASEQIPREIASLMITITEMRNAGEYNAKQMSHAEAETVRHAWTAVTEWAQSQGVELKL